MNETTTQPKQRGTGWCGIGSWFAGLGLGAALIGILGAGSGLLNPIGAF